MLHRLAYIYYPFPFPPSQKNMILISFFNDHSTPPPFHPSNLPFLFDLLYRFAPLFFFFKLLKKKGLRGFGKRESRAFLGWGRRGNVKPHNTHFQKFSCVFNPSPNRYIFAPPGDPTINVYIREKKTPRPPL